MILKALKHIAQNNSINIKDISNADIFAISTKEVISCGENHCAQLWLRTSWARKGIICSFGKIDSGFKGNLTLLGLNASKKNIDIEIGNTFAQIVLEQLSTAANELYEERSGNYQNQKGITWSKE